MNNEISIKVGKQLTMEEYLTVASRATSLIAEAAKDLNEINETFSVSDLIALFNKASMHMSGEFEIHRTPSCYCQIVYKPYEPPTLYEPEFDKESEFYENYIPTDLGDTPHDGQNCLWVSERVLSAFMNRELYGVAFMLYFYLGYLMRLDDAFALSHNISFEKLVESCNEFPEAWRVKHRTTLMRAIADLQEVGFIKWKKKTGTFEVLHITPYDPVQKA